MEAQTWTLIGILMALVLGAFVRVEMRFDQLSHRMDMRLDRLHEDLIDVRTTLLGHERRFDAIDGRLEQHDRRFDDLEGRLEQHDRRFDDLVTLVKDQGETLAGAIYSIATKLDEHLRRHAS